MLALVRRRGPMLLLAVGAIFAIGSEAFVLFGGRYVPYIDWSNHLGLISIFGHGEQMGALAYAERSWAPRPYLLFYIVAAAFSFLTTVPAAAKWAMACAAAMSVVGFGGLLRATGRPVVAALLAPLVLYGYARGYGFSSFIFSLPLVFFALAAFEVLLTRIRTERPPWWAMTLFAAAFLACYLGHALVVLPTGLAIGVRLAVFMVGGLRTRAGIRRAFRALVYTGAAALPALLCAATVLAELGPDREVGATLHRSDVQIFLWGSNWAARWAGLGGHMLERGSPQHWTTMYGVAAFFGVLVVVHVAQAIYAVVRQRHGGWQPGDSAALAYGLFFLALYGVGPESLGWPYFVWMVYPRYATLAAAVLVLLPRPRLAGWAQVGLAVAALGLVGHNAQINRRHVAAFSRWASNYDAIRAAVPPKTTVLALTRRDPGDWIGAHHALGSLYFYHLCDGAAYTAFLFDNSLHPVRLKRDRPHAPPWNNVGAYSPAVHGVEFDYVVLRGKSFIQATEAAGRHDVVLRHQGWVVFKTKRP